MASKAFSDRETGAERCRVLWQVRSRKWGRCAMTSAQSASADVSGSDSLDRPTIRA